MREQRFCKDYAGPPLGVAFTVGNAIFSQYAVTSAAECTSPKSGVCPYIHKLLSPIFPFALTWKKGLPGEGEPTHLGTHFVNAAKPL